MTLHDPHLSTCDSIVLGGRGNGFVVEHWRAPYLNPTADNVFMLLGCSTQSPLFQGFPTGNHVPCRNVSACEATGGSCGHDVEHFGELCMCGSWNSTSNCDTIMKLSVGGASLPRDKLLGLLIVISTFWLTSFRM
ncbi:unnamed protein product [Lactuca virosa]|uniref:EGF-like domain-containing protein n=1 Tax=Lactuca virosa TaxID=75947 RepID=A0AAU9MSE6_9ASTR|nr:unnamed protein product [Lactuca virosa]